MAKRKTTELTTITAASLAAGDWFPVVDVSDTTMSSTGTNKKLAKSELAEAAGVTAHLADTNDAHDASAISFSATGNLSATDVQAAIAELDSEKAAVAEPIAAAHIADTSDAHDASAISVLDTAGNYTATDVEGVLAEIATEFVPGANRPHYLDAYNQFFAGPFVSGQGSTSTTLTAQATAGASTMSVASGASFPNGTVIITNQGAATQKQYTVTSGGGTTTLTVTPSIVTTLANGATITPLWTNASHLTPAGYTAFSYWLLNANDENGDPIFTDPGSGSIVWLGNSWPVNGATEFAAQVAAKFPSATVVNAGVSGNTSTLMLARFATDVPAGAAYVIINEPGINDVYQSVTAETMTSNLTSLINSIRALGATPVVTGMVPLQVYPGQSARRSRLLLAHMSGGAAFPAAPVSASLAALSLSSVATSVAFGGNAQLNATGGNNTAVGYQAQLALTDGSGNTAVGQSAQAAITSGANNVAIGHLTQQTLTTGTFNTAIGQGAQSSMSGATANNTSIGAYASLSLTTGSDNTHIGSRAGYAPAEVPANATTTGAFQTCIGRGAGQGTTTQVDAITCIGAYAVASGANATAIGSATSAGAAGAVAIGRDSGGTGASTTTADEIKVGTANHTTNIIGNASIGGSGKTLGFFGATPAAKPTGVAVSAAGIHAALVTLGLIAA